MDDKNTAGQSFRFRTLFPRASQLFRIFGIAIDVRKIFLAVLGIGMIWAGNLLFAMLPFAPESDEPLAPPWQEIDRQLFAASNDTAPSIFNGLLPEFLQGRLPKLSNCAGLLLEPLRQIAEPAWNMLNFQTSWSEVAYSWTQLLWALLVWSFFAGAITRMAAVQFSQDERMGVRTALKFSSWKFLSFLTAPLLPLLGFGLCWVLCLVGGVVGRYLPGAGEIVLGVFWFLPLLCGFLMSLILIGMTAGWPLMLSTISAEGSDAFDGFSRSFDYVYNRPWHYFFYLAVSGIYGAFVILFVFIVLFSTVYLSGRGVSTGLGIEQTSTLLQSAPNLLAPNSQGLVGGVADPAALTTSIGNKLATFWINGLAIVFVGFVHSFFWSAATVVYFLLRQSADGTAFDRVYMSEEETEDDLLPLVGVADSDQPVIERPAGPKDDGAE